MPIHSISNTSISSNGTHLNTVKSTNSTIDKDLVELAGKHAYLHPNRPDTIKVNGNNYKVLNVNKDSETGLDAFVIKNVNDKNNENLIIVYVGSEQIVEDWLLTNGKLPSDLAPEQIDQIHAAREYFKEVEEELGKVTHVTGNSLGGALSNAVAVDNPGVTSVTLNPALLPDGMVDPNKDYSNITNYISKYDALNLVINRLGLGHRVPGSKYNINNGLPIFSLLSPNHVGYHEDENGNFFYEVGKPGDAGYGHIYVDADEHIMTSIWTGAPLYGGPTGKIDINVEAMLKLAEAIQQKVKQRLTLSGEYIRNANLIVDDEISRFNIRVTILQETFQQMFDELAGEPMFNGIARTGNRIKSYLDGLISLLNIAEEKCRGLNVILNSMPMELIEYIRKVDISVESLFAYPKNYLYDIQIDIDNFVRAIQIIIEELIPDLFRGAKDNFVDAVTGELDLHYALLEKNKDRLLDQLENYGTQVQGVATALQNKDASIASATRGKGGDIQATDNVQHTAIITLEKSDYLEVGMKIKEIQTNLAHQAIRSSVTVVLTPILEQVSKVIRLLEGALEAIIVAINSAQHVVLYGNPTGLALSLFTKFDDNVKAQVKEVKAPIKEMEATIEGLRDGVNRLIANLPGMVDDFKPYIDTALFEPGKFANVRLYNVAASAILDEMNLVFDDIIYQLSGEKSQAVTESLEISKSIKGNIGILGEQVERGTI
ncbi:SA1320 family protein [Paucisalibacillus globulus]|uniref:SA1320 family protein n=1 Tax=Paucisalibacillus globulus TaxID=351095 RepID=UPI0003F705FD|nr:hypothetical protein [Paucisalibacillus globulus]